MLNLLNTILAEMNSNQKSRIDFEESVAEKQELHTDYEYDYDYEFDGEGEDWDDDDDDDFLYYNDDWDDDDDDDGPLW